MDVSKNNGTPKWMVKIMENPIKMDDLGGPPLFLETLIYIYIILYIYIFKIWERKPSFVIKRFKRLG